VLGTGYGAYWVGPIPSSPSAVFLTRIYVYPTQSHNGFLEIVNDLGFVGLFILLGYLITHVKQCLALLKVDRILPPLLLAILFQQIIINLSEACWVTAKNASSLIMTFSTIAVACALVEHRRKTPLQAPSTARSVPGRRVKTPTLARSRP
jgi:O-antigen ligase